MYINCCVISNFTVKYRHSFSKLDDILGELHESCIISKIDLKHEYHQIRMKERNEWKTVFKSKYGLYKWLVMSFELTNTHCTFMRLINHVLYNFIFKFIVVCFEDILIYSKNLEKHVKHLRNVLVVLWKECLYSSLKMCDFLMENIVFLRYLLKKRACVYLIILCMNC
jgi:hypothetical protein